MRAYQQEHRPALTAPPYPVELFPGQQDYHINHPNNEGSPDAHTAFPPWDIIQIMGKQDSEPIPEYRARIKEFISHLRTEGVQAQWHPTDAVHPNDERNEVVDDIYDLMEYYNDYRDGNYENHDYPSITQQRQREGLDDGTDDYGLPPHQHEDDGLYVGRDSIENIVLQAIKHFTENDRNRWYHNDLQYSPDEIAQGLIFLLNELKIQNRPVLNRPYLNWDDTMNAAIEEGEKEIDKQIDEIRELNYDYEWENLNGAWQQVLEQNEGDYDEDAEIDYDHPDVQWAQRYVDNELTSHFRQAIEFLNDLRSLWAGVHPNQEVPQAPADIQKQIDQDPDVGSPNVPGALSHWTLAS
jgi:hypothetical protein